MSTPRLRRAKEVFEQALTLPDHRRSEFIHTACDGDADLEREVCRLIRFDAEECGLLDRATGDRTWSALMQNESPDADPDVKPEHIGPYRILDRLGVGGMGIVYRAHEDSPPRDVALKVLRSDSLSESALARFEHEVSVLARLEHPGIARIYRAGSTRSDVGQCPYFSMELVDGHPLPEDVRRRGLTIRGRLELFLGILEAIDHAHERGIVHRDLKPENILIDAAGNPKVLDFGIARSLDGDGARHTATGQVVGTMAYMSPEQLFDGEIDRRSDVYSLGVIFYELLAGRSPFDLSGGNLRQAVHRVQDLDAIPLGIVAPELKGDLEAIAQMALEKDAANRYLSAAAFAADIRHCLKDEPVMARRSTTLYHIRKFARRNKVLVGGALATALALVAGSIVSVLFAIQAQRDSALAEQRRQEATASRAAMRESLYQAKMLEGSTAVLAPQGLGRVREIVDAWRPTAGEVDHRGWEWGLLNERSRSKEGVFRPLAQVFDIDLHPDGRTLAVGGQGGLRIGDLDTDSWSTIELPPGNLYSVCWSASGDRLVVAGEPGLLMLDPREAETPLLWRRELLHPVGQVTWGPQQDEFQLTGFWVGLAVHSAKVGSLRSSPSTTGAEPDVKAALSDRGDRVAQVGKGAAVNVIDLESNEVLRSLEAESKEPAMLSWSPGGELLAEGHWDGTVTVWDAVRGTRLLVDQEHGNRIADLVWSPDGRWLASAGWDQTVRIWDPRQNLAVATLRGHETRVTSLDWSDDGARLVSSAALDAVRVWEVADWVGARSRFNDGFIDRVSDVRLEWHPDGRLLRVTSDRTALLRIEGHRIVESLEVSRGELLADDSSATDVDRWTERRLSGLERPRHEIKPWGLRWHPADEMVLAGMNKFHVHVSGGVHESAWSQLPLNASVVQDIAWDPLSQWLVIAGDGKLLRANHESSQIEQIAIGRFSRVAWAPEGRFLAAASKSGRTQILRSGDWTEVSALRGASRQVTAVAWHPGGQRLATTDRHRSLKIWDPWTGELQASFELRTRAMDVAWDSKGRVLALVTTDGIVELWDAGEGW